MSWLDFHRHSERLASQAHEHLRAGEAAQAEQLFREAAEAEETALDLLDGTKPRTLGIVVVSAAWLWFRGAELDRVTALATRHLEGELIAGPFRSELEELLKLADERRAERDSALLGINDGDVRVGTVTLITEYGAFVDLGGIQGLLHITDISWRRIGHPADLIQVGQELKVKVLKVDSAKRRVLLGLKQLSVDPWVGLRDRIREGSRLSGNVTKIADYGVFVELEPAVEGLVHVSEIDWVSKNIDTHRAVALGQRVEVMVLEIDEDKRRISLGMKQCQSNPWEEFAQAFRPGDRVKGSVKAITDFGVFIRMPSGIDGLVHVSDLSWDATDEALRRFRKDQEVEALVLNVDATRERISLGIKQLEADPFEAFVSQVPLGTVVQGLVVAVERHGARVRLADGVFGHLPANRSGLRHYATVRDRVSEGDELTATVTSVDRRARSVELSVVGSGVIRHGSDGRIMSSPAYFATPETKQPEAEEPTQKQQTKWAD